MATSSHKLDGLARHGSFYWILNLKCSFFNSVEDSHFHLENKIELRAGDALIPTSSLDHI